ncbi:MAG TPA: LysR substrate-binding domain-containing protein [Kofleriaceae bacterium]|nr:LysR substrate-binding domain-containing protein [Kofleriaceae bacterium]
MFSARAAADALDVRSPRWSNCRRRRWLHALQQRHRAARRNATLAGLGVARLPTWIVADDLAKKRLVRVLPTVTMPIIEIYGMFHAGSKGSTAIHAVLDFLRTELPRRPTMVRG